jgi:two-component system, response regulator YesN
MAAKTILIVDDEQTTRQGLKKTLEIWSAGRYEILSAEDGPGAYEIFSKTRVHLLITDVCMPEMTGLKLLNALKEKGHKPVVLIVSGHPEFEYAQEAIRLGVLNYLLKPLSKQKLIEAVEKAMEAGASIERADYIEKVADSELLKIESSNDLSKTAIKEAIAYVNNNLNRQISLKEVADFVHFNPSYLSVVFKEQTRLTFSEYITRKRMQAAKNLLLTTDLSIEEIAKETGYQTSKYFIKLFKDYEGITPSKYRKLSAYGETKD